MHARADNSHLPSPLYTAKHKQLKDTYIHKNFSIAPFFIQENHIIRSFPAKASKTPYILLHVY
jgi:hypothetical protein